MVHQNAQISLRRSTRVLKTVYSRLSRPLLQQAIKFGVVGTINTLLDLVVLNLLIQLTHKGEAGPLFTLFKTVSFLVAMVNSYWMNAKWTFGNKASPASAIQGAQFVFVSVVGSVLNIGSASYVATYIHPPLELKVYWPSMAALVGTICSFVFNFLGYRYFVFSPRETSGLEAVMQDPAAPPADGD